MARKVRHAKDPKQKVSRLSPSASRKRGLAPGTPVHIGRHTTGEVDVMVSEFNADSYVRRDAVSPSELVRPQTAENFTWVHVTGVHDVDVIAEICRPFDIHPLSVEDLVNTTQRPKIDVYDEYIFVVVRDPVSESDDDEARSDQIGLILGPGFVLSFQETASSTFQTVIDRLEAGRTRIRSRGAGYLLYSLLDAVIDNYFTVLESLGERIEELESSVLTDPTPAANQRIHTLRHEVIHLRRAVWPLREVISSLRNEEQSGLMGADTRIYLNDLHDHSIQVLESIESYRETISGLLDIYLSSLSYRMNEIMKVLTIFSAIFIPMTLVAGIYGMNFNTAKSPFNMPELDWFLGYPFALGLMAAICLVMVIFLKHRKWL